MLKFLVSFFNFVLFEEMTPPPKKKTANGNNILSKINILTSSKYEVEVATYFCIQFLYLKNENGSLQSRQHENLIF